MHRTLLRPFLAHPLPAPLCKTLKNELNYVCRVLTIYMRKSCVKSIWRGGLEVLFPK